MTALIDQVERKAIFELRRDSNQLVYMSEECTNAMNDERYVVVVDANKFLTLWKNEPNPRHRYLSFGNEAIWKADYKYHYAEQCFSQSKINPIPLANVVCYINENNKLPYTSFIDGITRTIWLLANGVEYFPIECGGVDSANLLVQAAGHKNTDISSVAELLHCD